MFFFDHDGRRQTLPKSFQNLGTVQRELAAYYALDPKERLQTDVPLVWKHTLERDVLDALTTLSYSKCPFCEQAGVRLQPYRFRPPAYASPMKQPEDKECYLWLAFHWDNFFPICEGCLPQDKAFFPVDGPRTRPPESSADPISAPGLKLDEKPRLYFPGEMEQPAAAFDVRIDGGLLAKNRRAEVTIEHFRLNRPDLVHHRGESLARWISDLRESPRAMIVREKALFSTPQFGGTLYLFLRRLAGRLLPRFGPRHPLSVERLFDTLLRWSPRDDFVPAVLQALDDLHEEDARTPVVDAKFTAAAAPAPRRPRSQLRAVTISNYKSLEAISFALPDPPRDPAAGREPHELPPTPCLLILGENSTGKSSILEAIVLATVPDEMRNQLVPTGEDARKLTLNPKYLGKTGNTTARNCRIDLEFRDGGRAGLAISAKDGDIRSRGRLKGERPLVFAYGAHRLFGRTRLHGDIRRIETLFRNDRQISNPEPWLAALAETRPEVLDEVVSALRHIIRIDGDFRNIEVVRDGQDTVRYCVINVRKKKQDGGEYIVPQRLDIVSSGYRAVLALVCDVLEGLMEVAPDVSPRDARHGEAIVLVDEIEAHLHPRWKLQIVAGLRRALPRVTFIITSHDPLCVRGMRDGEVMMLHRYQNTGGEGPSSMPEVVERVADFDNIETMTIEQLLTSEMFQLFSADDRRTDHAFAEMADLLARGQETLDDNEKALLADFNAAIADGLPYGRTEVTRVVQEAVAEYLALRRVAGSRHAGKAREAAKDAVKAFLEGLLQ